jgi:CMD domain protein
MEVSAMTQAPEASATPSTTNDQDLLNRWAGIAPDSALARLRAERADVAGAGQRSYQVLLEPDDPAGVSRLEREMVALRVALLTPCPPLVAWHRQRLLDLGATEATVAAIEQFPAGPAQPARERAVLDYVDRLTRAPGTATAEHLAELKAAGLTPPDIVTIAQLIALLCFEARVLAGLRLLEDPR